MPCYHPMTAYRQSAGRNEKGKWPITFNRKEGYEDKKITIPCGKCIGCKLERSRQWAIRCINEASLHPENCFITLTYDENHINQKGTLIKEDFVLFMKRLRKKYEPKKIRFFQCGEYGENFDRPHHHACIFNHNFTDRLVWIRKNGVSLYRSAELEKLWTKGFSSIGDVTFESAAYTARYITKKITGEQADKHYNGKEPEYVTMSRRPGIGKEWYDKFKNDVYNYDQMIVRDSLKCKPAKYYDKKFGEDHPFKLERLKYRREKKAIANPRYFMELARIEEVKTIKSKQLKRSFEGV